MVEYGEGPNRTHECRMWSSSQGPMSLTSSSCPSSEYPKLVNGEWICTRRPNINVLKYATDKSLTGICVWDKPIWTGQAWYQQTHTTEDLCTCAKGFSKVHGVDACCSTPSSWDPLKQECCGDKKVWDSVSSKCVDVTTSCPSGKVPNYVETWKDHFSSLASFIPSTAAPTQADCLPCDILKDSQGQIVTTEIHKKSGACVCKRSVVSGDKTVYLQPVNGRCESCGPNKHSSEGYFSSLGDEDTAQDCLSDDCKWAPGTGIWSKQRTNPDGTTTTHKYCECMQDTQRAVFGPVKPRGTVLFFGCDERDSDDFTCDRPGSGETFTPIKKAWPGFTPIKKAWIECNYWRQKLVGNRKKTYAENMQMFSRSDDKEARDKFFEQFSYDMCEERGAVVTMDQLFGKLRAFIHKVPQLKMFLMSLNFTSAEVDVAAECGNSLAEYRRMHTTKFLSVTSKLTYLMNTLATRDQDGIAKALEQFGEGGWVLAKAMKHSGQTFASLTNSLMNKLGWNGANTPGDAMSPGGRRLANVDATGANAEDADVPPAEGKTRLIMI